MRAQYCLAQTIDTPQIAEHAKKTKAQSAQRCTARFRCACRCSRPFPAHIDGHGYLIYRAVTTAYETSFHLPWAASGIAVLSVFLVVFATMMYAMRKVKKDNPIDALKNENL